MKVQLRDYVNQGGTTRHPEIARIDWAARAVFLPDGRWIPFEAVVIGESQQAKTVIDGRPGAQLPPYYAGAELKCDTCGRTDFTKASSLGGHRRHCGKGKT